MIEGNENTEKQKQVKELEERRARLIAGLGQVEYNKILITAEIEKVLAELEALQ